MWCPPMCPPSVAEILRSRVTLELEGIDRMYLNVYVPKLQGPSVVGAFLRYHCGAQYTSSVLLRPINEAFVSKMERFTTAHQIPVITFRKGERKDNVAKEALAAFTKAGGTGRPALRRESPGEDAGDPHGKAAQPAYRSPLSVARLEHGHSESLVLVRGRSRLRSLFPQGLQPLPLHGEGLPQRHESL